jgi:hypothetical protein
MGTIIRSIGNSSIPINRIRRFLLFLTIMLIAQSVSASKPDSTWHEWKFRIGPYFWFFGLDGEFEEPPNPPEINSLPGDPPPRYSIDVGFKDISNSLKFAGMLTGVYRNKYLITQFQFTGLNLESHLITPKDYVLQDNVIRFSYYSGDFGIGYRAIKRPKFDFEILAGFKFLYTKVTASSNLFGQKVMEPVLSSNFRYHPWNRWEFTLYGDWGANLFDQDYTYQYLIGTTFYISRKVFITLGYRDQYVQQPNEKAIFNGRMNGYLVRLGLQF